ncbi:hypothetical protein Tcan_00237 [Toxocara canis]|uniref:Uncharacterized protein n=1 Tax=Toxocara canis TaxID=6265 RepID=A0A0B2V7V2_TOXCA|nr:hypothetical protein Tcan_00237 [Toxocara canis]
MRSGSCATELLHHLHLRLLNDHSSVFCVLWKRTGRERCVGVWMAAKWRRESQRGFTIDPFFWSPLQEGSQNHPFTTWKVLRGVHSKPLRSSLCVTTSLQWFSLVNHQKHNLSLISSNTRRNSVTLMLRQQEELEQKLGTTGKIDTV